MLPYRDAVAQRDEIDKILTATSKRLREFPRGTTGLTPDHVKATEEWQIAKAAGDMAFRRFRDINGFIVKHYGAELKRDRRNKRKPN